jgi:hypothetical protein
VIIRENEILFDPPPPKYCELWRQLGARLKDPKGKNPEARHPENIRSQMEAIFREHFRLRESNRREELVFGEQMSGYSPNEKEKHAPRWMPYCDHTRQWVGPNKRKIMTSEPYGAWDDKYIDEVREHCEAFAMRKGFLFGISKEWAFWNPGQTLLIWWEKEK